MRSRQQLGRRHPQRDVGVPDLGLGPGNALPDSGFGLQQRAGDLGDGQPGHQPQRQRQLRHSVECRMRAGEHHPQLVVADRVNVHLGARPDLVDHRGQFLSRAHRLATQSVAGAVARHGQHPSAGVVRHAVARPRPQRLGEGFLDGVLGDGEITRPSGQRGHGRAPLPPKDAVQVDHSWARAPTPRPTAAPRQPKRESSTPA